jgi:hypothetical protein
MPDLTVCLLVAGALAMVGVFIHTVIKDMR